MFILGISPINALYILLGFCRTYIMYNFFIKYHILRSK